MPNCNDHPSVRNRLVSQSLLLLWKKGYARDVIEVVEDESGNVVPALLYRGTPSNPAIWPRALKDLPFAAGTCK